MTFAMVKEVCEGTDLSKTNQITVRSWDILYCFIFVAVLISLQTGRQTDGHLIISSHTHVYNIMFFKYFEYETLVFQHSILIFVRNILYINVFEMKGRGFGNSEFVNLNS
jgi:hypothetical protein